MRKITLILTFSTALFAGNASALQPFELSSDDGTYWTTVINRTNKPATVQYRAYGCIICYTKSINPGEKASYHFRWLTSGRAVYISTYDDHYWYHCRYDNVTGKTITVSRKSLQGSNCRTEGIGSPITEEFPFGLGFGF